MAHQRILHTRTLLGPLPRTAVGLELAALLLIGTPTSASGSPRDPIPPTNRPWGYSFGARQQGRPGATTGGGSTRSGEGSSSNASGGSDAAPPPPDLCGAFRFGVRACTLPEIPTDAGGQRPTVTPAQLAATAWARLPIPQPDVRTAPPRGSSGLVGLSEWFWVTNWSTHTGRAEAGGVWAEVTARPTSLTISPGAGQPSVNCSGPGTAYDSKRPATQQRSDCSFTYTRSSAGLSGAAYQVTVTVTWGGTWVGSGGTGGTLPALSRSTSFRLRVAEGQAVTGG
jgi:hypothetical protein